MMRWLHRVLRTAKHVARSESVPRWLRWLFIFGLLPIPIIPIDEAALVLAVGLMAVFYRDQLREEWNKSCDVH